MKLAVLSVLALVFMLNTFVLAQNHWMCTCFEPKYDRGCCAEVGYHMMVDGNVCKIGRKDVKSKEKFEKCCHGISGRTKCK
ncbi:uncharacterized protein ATC70_005532 [Mucor velutinosus]|uniref:Uncharacterized protein n=1 Tax=Mucor velutinosus TaxID=708070 RepID=A0AAN7HS88_9FUNG|nr:hypothetical protein ATC70_005532 [Mucor velutinosus]